ncbi:MAG TPA: GFA family protein [Rhodospirillales bacterium]|nr:GFA family protein [Rhodospirillales bacterium]
MADMSSGTCFCGAVAIEASCEPVEMGYCHCHSCRHYSGAPLVAFTLWRADQVRVSRGAELLGRINKAGMSEQRFCTRCGGHVMIELAGFGFIDVYPDVLPGVAFQPSVHLNYAERVLPVRDGLPKLKDFPTEAGGSGEVVPE